MSPQGLNSLVFRLPIVYCNPSTCPGPAEVSGCNVQISELLAQATNPRVLGTRDQNPAPGIRFEKNEVLSIAFYCVGVNQLSCYRQKRFSEWQAHVSKADS